MTTSTNEDELVKAIDEGTAKLVVDALLFKRHVYAAGEAEFQNPNNNPEYRSAFEVTCHEKYQAITNAVQLFTQYLPEKERKQCTPST